MIRLLQVQIRVCRGGRRRREREIGREGERERWRERGMVNEKRKVLKNYRHAE